MTYFDTLPQKIKDGDLDAIKAFGRNIHWGYWPNPSQANGTLEDFAIASENLTQQVLKMAKIENGQKILDAGCGFGGTVARINENYDNMQLVGVNINSEQVIRAQEIVIPHNSNQITFLNENACQIPIKTTDFDRIVALECIFSFPSRLEFFQEAYRLLKPKGTLTICDFLPVEFFAPFWTLIEKIVNPLVGKSYGTVKTNTPIITFISLSDYEKLAKKIGFELVEFEDISDNVLPTYAVVNRIMSQGLTMDMSTGGLAFVSKLKLIRYGILSLRKV